jgi:hypothetical protein
MVGEHLTELKPYHAALAEKDAEIARLRTALDTERFIARQRWMQVLREGARADTAEASLSLARERIGKLEEERATVVRFVTRIHDALADPSRPRQSVGEMVARLLSDMEARARALLPTQEPPRDAR